MSICLDCGAYDDHPRHVFQCPPNHPGNKASDTVLDGLPDEAKLDVHAMEHLLDPTSIYLCKPCCSARGCVICGEILRATGNASGADLRKAILDGKTAHLNYDPAMGV